MHQLPLQLVIDDKTHVDKIERARQKKKVIYTLASSFDPGGKKGPHHPDSYLE